MNAELNCADHGPYLASYGKCPICGRVGTSMPPAPASLYANDQTTTKAPGASPRGNVDPDATVLPGQSGQRAVGRPAGGIDETQPPIRGGKGGGYEENNETVPPHRQRSGGINLDEPFDNEDETVIDRPERMEIGLLGWLIVKSSRYMRRGQILKVHQDAIYGRSTSKTDVVIDDDKVSKIHARIQIKDNKIILRDMGSENGTWLNGEEISGPTEINQDDEIRIGETVFVLKTLT
jgi:hypothetical protein